MTCPSGDPLVYFTFSRMVKTKRGEAVWFSFITFKSRAHRDAVNKKVMAYFGKKYADSMMAVGQMGTFVRTRTNGSTWNVEANAASSGPASHSGTP